jgi:linalool 8-monooxygenase
MKGVSPVRVREMEDRIRARVVALLDSLPSGGVDVVSALSAPLPIKTLIELLDAPLDVENQLCEWTNALIGEDDPTFRQSPEYMAKVIADLSQFGGKLLEPRRNGNGLDMVTLISKTTTGDEVSMNDFFANFILIIIGGNETTRNSISGGLHALAKHPDQYRMLVENPALIPEAVKEIVRWVTPVMHMRRTTTEDIEVRGVPIKKGTKVLFWYPSANRDEDVWDKPFEFDITRPTNRHMGFGVGQHMCIGNRLAEMQIRVFLEEFLPRFKHIELLKEPSRIRSNFIQGIKELQMQFTRA